MEESVHVEPSYPWEVVHDGKLTYYYNRLTQQSSWELPRAETQQAPGDKSDSTQQVKQQVEQIEGINDTQLKANIKNASIASLNYSPNTENIKTKQKIAAPETSFEVAPTNSGQLDQLYKSYTDEQKYHQSQMQLELFRSVSTEYVGSENIRRLLEAGADPSLRNTDGNLAIHVAANGGYYDCIQTMVEFAGLWLLKAIGENGDTLAHCCCRAGQWAVATAETIKVLIGDETENAKIFEQVNNNNQTPLHAAVMYENVQILQWLLDCGFSNSALTVCYSNIMIAARLLLLDLLLM